MNIEKLSLAFDMRAKEVGAGLHGWDAATQSLRVELLGDVAAALVQYLRDTENSPHRSCASCMGKGGISPTACATCNRNWNHTDNWKAAETSGKPESLGNSNVPLTGGQPPQGGSPC